MLQNASKYYVKRKIYWHKKYAYKKGKNCISVHNEGQACLLDLVLYVSYCCKFL